MDTSHHESPAQHKSHLRKAWLAARLISFIIPFAVLIIATPFDASHIISEPNPWSLTSVLLRWDAFHYLTIAMEGKYRFEHQFAFFPGTPIILKLSGESILRSLNILGLKPFTKEQAYLAGGSIASLLLCNWTGDLYE